MADDIEALEAEFRDALRQVDEDLRFAISEVAPELVERAHLNPPPTLRARPTIADYDRDLARVRRPGLDAFGHLRDLVLIGIRVGTISVEDVYLRVRPATVALTVLLDPGAGATAAALARRIRRGAGWGAGRGLGRGLGLGPGLGRWVEAIVAVDHWPGSLHSLLRQEPQDEGGHPPHTLLGMDDHLWRGGNILLALAPPGTLSRIASEAAPMGVTGRIVGEPQAVRYARALLRLASHAPLSRTFVDYALTEQASARVRIALASNALTPNATLSRLVTDGVTDAEPGVAAAISLHECAPPAVRLAAFRKVRDPAVLSEARETLRRDVDVVRRIQRIASASADEADLVHALLRDAGPELPFQARLFAYAHLARMSGPEAVWVLEMGRAGSLEAMHPAVRASMAAGSALPLLEAAVADPYRGMHHDAVSSVAALRREELLDWPFPWQDSADPAEVSDPADPADPADPDQLD
ncbi:hypothetical protein ABH935_005308 [Catenulispora sp. GAS73]|uniref:hypothetical protein n=1 Tax=Catenulispora sp. GAS73 TaxID=3156269 RepID=UPI003516EF9F